MDDLESVVRECKEKIEQDFRLDFEVKLNYFSTPKEAESAGKECSSIASSFFDGKHGEIIFIGKEYLKFEPNIYETLIKGILAEEFGHLKYFFKTENESLREVHTNIDAYQLHLHYFSLQEAVNAGYREELRTFYKKLIEVDTQELKESGEQIFEGCINLIKLFDCYPGAVVLGLRQNINKFFEALPESYRNRLKEIHEALLDRKTYENEQKLLSVCHSEAFG